MLSREGNQRFSMDCINLLLDLVLKRRLHLAFFKSLSSGYLLMTAKSIVKLQHYLATLHGFILGNAASPSVHIEF